MGAASWPHAKDRGEAVGSVCMYIPPPVRSRWDLSHPWCVVCVPPPLSCREAPNPGRDRGSPAGRHVGRARPGPSVKSRSRRRRRHFPGGRRLGRTHGRPRWWEGRDRRRAAPLCQGVPVGFFPGFWCWFGVFFPPPSRVNFFLFFLLLIIIIFLFLGFPWMV